MRQQAHRLNRTSSAARARTRRPAFHGRVARLVACAAAVLLVPGFVAAATAQMPDARSMSGIARPVDDLPAGTVSVRVVRGDLARVVADIPVELAVAGKSLVIRTDADGRAEFKGVAPGASVRASATLDGERLASEAFAVPPTGGVRILLSGPLPGAAPDAGATTTAASTQAAAPGTVVFGGDSRVVIQFADDELEVYYLLDIVNSGSAPLKTEPLVFEMPPEAQGTSLLEGSSPQAAADGRRVTIAGPFAPGRTVVQLAYTLAPGGGRVRIAQRFPAALAQVSVIVQKVGAMTVLSPAIREERETMDQGRAFLMGTGPGLAAGETLVVDLAGLPHVAVWPRNLALALAALVLVVGAWTGARTGSSGATAARDRLTARREQLLSDVEKLDGQLRAGRIEPRRHAARRDEYLRELEHIYGALDSGADARGGDMRHAG